MGKINAALQCVLESVDSTIIKDGGVVEAKIGTGAVTEAKLGSGAVTVAKIGNTEITYAKMNLSAGDIPESKLTFNGTAGHDHSGGTNGKSVIVQGENIVADLKNEKAAGTINGTNKAFTLSVAPADDDKAMLYFNGSLLEDTGTATATAYPQYQLAGTAITLGFAPTDSGNDVLRGVFWSAS